ncbi:Thiolase, N-terminal domain-containing protein [Xylariaceae sp. FL0594]|nr:Thiolase, N-terminal domain-containing protein [Xylariaceae sp. FL0594]
MTSTLPKPPSPVGRASSFKSETNDDRPAETSQVIRSSLTPPPSSHVAHANRRSNAGAPVPLSRANSQATSSLYSPPPTTALQASDRRPPRTNEDPSADQINTASASELRAMLQSSLSSNAKLKSEAAHYKLQYQLLSLQAVEDANRASVEHEMTRREVEALRIAEHARQAKRELDARTDTTHIKYRELQRAHEALVKEHGELSRRLKSASRVIQQQAEKIDALQDERDMLLNRIRENRQHFHMLCSPGGAFHGALTPTTPTATSPQAHSSTPRQTPRSATRGARHAVQGDATPFAVLLEALSQDNTSAPPTPTSAHLGAPRGPVGKHRAAHSLSSLPATPLSRSRGNNPGLLPSIDLVPRTEPPQRYGDRVEPQTPTERKRRKSRESTISAEDEAEGNARKTLESVATAAQSLMSQGSRPSQAHEGEEEVLESSASQEASEMLRKDPRESFDVASSVSRDVTPTPADRLQKLQTRLYGAVHKGPAAASAAAVKKMASTTLLPRGLKAVLAKAPNDVVILSSLRTPITRSYKGGLKDAYPEELLYNVLLATRQQLLRSSSSFDAAEVVEDVAVGVVLSELGGSKAGRMALNAAGFRAETTSLYTVNRACSSSLQAISAVAAQIRTGDISCGIAAGTESMSRNYGSRAVPTVLWPYLKNHEEEDVRDCVMPMGLTSEIVARRYDVSRADQDAFAAESHRRAARARDEGRFEGEIVPVTTMYQPVDKQGEKAGEAYEHTVDKDDGIRANVSAEALAKLKPAFDAQEGRSTAGNSSQVSDGAAASLLMRRSLAEELGLSSLVLGKFVGAVTKGCRPREMGIGPAVAIPALLARYGLRKEDVARWEINEAFASQAVYCVRELGLEKQFWDEESVNPDGGAIALGHPLGATGARMAATLLHGLGRTREREEGDLGVVSMCVGTGMGMAGLFVRE